MTAQQLYAPTTDDLEERDRNIAVPDELTSAEAKLVYLCPLVRGTTTVDELGDTLGLPKLALFSILQTLGKRDLVARDGDTVTTA
jgi:predicted transcriptional regulator